MKVLERGMEGLMFKQSKYIGQTIRGMYIEHIIGNSEGKDSSYDFFIGKCVYCGNELKKRRYIVASNNTCSICQCNRKRQAHGMSSERIYKIYTAIKDRTVLNSNNKQFKQYYKDRGVTLCKEWQGKNGFKNFYEWSMANGYTNKLTIDRIDVNGNYEPSNCRWADNHTQNSNRRNTWKATINGIEKAVCDWCIDYKVDYSVVYNRVKRKGWSIEKALSTPIKKDPQTTKSVIQYDLNMNYIRTFKSASEAGSICGFSSNCIRSCCNGKTERLGNYIWKFA